MREGRRPVLVVAALAAAVSSGCVHAPSAPRALKPREPVVLETVSFEAPAEDGWTIVDVSDTSIRMLDLQHLRADGTWDRRAWVEEWVSPDRGITPEQFLASARARLPVTDGDTVVTPPPADAMVLDERFGPRSASGTVRSEPTPAGADKKVRGTFHIREWIPSLPADRFVRVGWVERQDEAAGRGDAPWSDFMQSIRSPPPSGATRTVPDVVHRGPMSRPGWFAFGPLYGTVALRGERVTGGGLRGAAGSGVLFPRAGTMKGLEYDASVFIGRSDKWEASVATVGATWWAGFGRLRLGAGPELGAAFLERRATRDIISGFVVGARTSALVDVVRSDWGEVYLGADGSAGTPRLYRAELLLGFRLR